MAKKKVVKRKVTKRKTVKRKAVKPTKKDNFKIGIITILIIAILASFLKPPQIEHVTKCDGFDTGQTKTYTFGDYSYEVKLISAEETRAIMEINGERIIGIKNEWRPIQELELQIRDIKPSVLELKTISFCLKA